MRLLNLILCGYVAALAYSNKTQTFADLRVFGAISSDYVKNVAKENQIIKKINCNENLYRSYFTKFVFIVH